eukprot:4203521-Alexandrium_andersonii.AAC.1
MKGSNSRQKLSFQSCAFGSGRKGAPSCLRPAEIYEQVSTTITTNALIFNVRCVRSLEISN